MYYLIIFIFHIYFRYFRLTLAYIFKIYFEIYFGYQCWGVEPSVLCLLGRCAMTELPPQFWPKLLELEIECEELVFFILTSIIKLSFIKIQFIKYSSPEYKFSICSWSYSNISKSFLIESLFLLWALHIFPFFCVDFFTHSFEKALYILGKFFF